MSTTRGGEAVDVGGHGEDRGGGGDAGAADAGEDDVLHPLERLGCPAAAWSSTVSAGSGSAWAFWPPSMVTNEGQKPSTQE